MTTFANCPDCDVSHPSPCRSCLGSGALSCSECHCAMSADEVDDLHYQETPVCQKCKSRCWYCLFGAAVQMHMGHRACEECAKDVRDTVQAPASEPSLRLDV